MIRVSPAEFANSSIGKTKYCFLKAILIIVLLLDFILPTWAKAQPQSNPPSYTVVLTKDLRKKQPTLKFHCRDKVFLSFAWLGLQGKHKLSALWFDTNGKQQDQIDLEFLTDRPKVENWVALKFRDAPDLRNPLLPNFFSTNVIGDWQVKVLLDGNFLETLKFEVQCG